MHCSPDIIWVIKSSRLRWSEHVAPMGERILVGKCDRRTPLGKPRRRWEDNIKVNRREMGWRVLSGPIWLRIGTRSGVL